MQQCGHDCFACPYPDCVLNDEEEIVLTELEISESDRRDADAKRYNCEADYEDGKPAADARRREVKRRSYYAHRAEELRRMKGYYDTHKPQIKSYYDAYYEANREKINARRRERRKLKKALRKSEITQGEKKKG